MWLPLESLIDDSTVIKKVKGSFVIPCWHYISQNFLAYEFHSFGLSIKLSKDRVHIDFSLDQSVFVYILLFRFLLWQEVSGIVKYKRRFEILFLYLFNLNSQYMSSDQFLLGVYVKVLLRIDCAAHLEDHLACLGAEVNILFGPAPDVIFHNFVLHDRFESAIILLS